MAKYEFTEEQVTAAMERAVEEKGADYVYPGAATGECLYLAREGGPSCMVGHALVTLGVDEGDILMAEGGSAVTLGDNDGVAMVWDGLRLRLIDQHLAGALNAAQVLQDDGKPWGEALAAYKEAISK